MKKRKNPNSRLKKGDTVSGVLQPSAANRILYQRRLMQEIDAMHQSVTYWIKAQYKESEPRFRGVLKKENLEFRFRPTQHLKDVMQAATAENVGLIKSIPSQYFDQINNLVMNAVLKGSNLNELSSDLTRRYQITRKRAEFIARDQNAKLFSVINRTRCQEVGIKEGIWNHSPRHENARPSHLKADGKRFDLAKGMHLDGNWTWPGQEINCHCTLRPVIPVNNNAARINDKRITGP